ncbi:DUF6011 domain-containing protein [Kitasatospora sp. NPDC059648]|uniref:DUF6011 domain-containing protein n=1 Tax=Kitasatospora sp. NPDC059648 TaxID=3346894 RepID=UPI0036B800E1
MTSPEPLPGTDTTRALRSRVTCRRCHRPLHDPESRMLRLGPECRDPAERVARFEVEQETLPGVWPGPGCLGRDPRDTP